MLVANGVPHNFSVAVFTNSKFLCTALLGKCISLDSLRLKLIYLRRKITI